MTRFFSPERWRQALSHARLAARIILRPSFPLPPQRIDIIIPEGPRAARVEAFEEIARRLDVPETRRGDRQVAERRIGSLVIGTELPPDDLTCQFSTSGMSWSASDAAGRWAGSYVSGGAA